MAEGEARKVGVEAMTHDDQFQREYRERSRFDHEWHVAINRFMIPEKIGTDGWSASSFMYEAKTAWSESRRLALLFRMEREGKLAKTHQQCSHSAPEPVAENHLSCCLGEKCAACPYLLALDAAEITPEQRDEAKAWTCVTHIISKGGDPAKEGYILTVDDRMFWDRLYENMGAEPPEAETDG